jgi:hypothetical protein
MLTVKECREILEQDAEGLTDEEVIQIRDWLSMMADIAIESVEKSRAEKENKKDEKKSNHLHESINR